jgi:hypothetical protein
MPFCERVRRDRVALRGQWQRYYRLDRGYQTEPLYHGRVRVDYKLVHRIRENWSQKLKAELFPESRRWVGVTPERASAMADRPVLESLYRQYLHHYMQLRRLGGPYLRSLCLYGTAVTDLGWLLDERPIAVPEERRPHGRSRIGYREDRMLHYIGPTIRHVDLPLWYIWPTDCDRTEASVLCFEDQLMEQATVRRLAKTPIDPDDSEAGMQFEGVTAFLRRLPSGEITSREGADRWGAERERLAFRGLRHRSDLSEDPDPQRPIDLVRGYWKTAVPGEDAESEARWYWFAVGGSDTTFAFRRCPWWYDEPSYQAARFVALPHEFYGYGIPFVIDTIAYFMNDVLNQTGDALVWGLNPLVAIDPAAAQEIDTMKLSPGARWWVRNPRETIHWMEPPKESANFGMQAIQQLIGLANDASNVSPYGGAGLGASRARGRAVQTATAASLLSGEALLQVQDVRQTIEDEWLTPMLRRMYRLTQQFLDRDLILRVEGERGAPLVERRLGREDLVGDIDFEWISTSSTQNPQVRSQQAINLLQMVSRIPPEMLQADNKRISVAALVESIAEDILGTWEAARVVVPAQQALPARDPELENDLFRLGRGSEVQVAPADDDQRHLQVHQTLLADPRLPAHLQAQIGLHLQQHQAAMLAKQQLAQMQAQQQMAQLQRPPGPGGPGGGNGRPRPPGPAGPAAPTMNPGRAPQTATEDDLMRQMQQRGTV